MKKAIWMLCISFILLSVVAYRLRSSSGNERFDLSPGAVTDVSKLVSGKMYFPGSINSGVTSTISPALFGGSTCQPYPSTVYIEYSIGRNSLSAALCPQQLVEAGITTDGEYWYKPPGVTNPVLLFTRFGMGDNRPWVLVHTSLPRNRQFVAATSVRDDTNSEGGAALAVYNASNVTFLLRTTPYGTINYGDSVNMWNPNPIGGAWFRVTFTVPVNSAINLVVFNLFGDGVHDPNTIIIRDVWGDTGMILGQANYNCYGSTRVSVPLIQPFNGTRLYINFGKPSSGWQLFARGVEFFRNADNWENDLDLNIPVDGVMMQYEDNANRSWAYALNQARFNTSKTIHQMVMGNREGFKAMFGTNGGHGLYNGFNLAGRCNATWSQGSIGAGQQSLGCGGNTNSSDTPTATGAFPYASMWGNRAPFSYAAGGGFFGNDTTVPIQTYIWWESRNMTGVSQSIPALSPQQLQSMGYTVDGFYWYQTPASGMTTPVRLYTRFNMVDGRAWCLAMSTITSKWTMLNHANNPAGQILPFRGLFIQDFDYSQGVPVFTPPSNGFWSYLPANRNFTNAVNGQTASTSTLTSGGNRPGMRVYINGAGAHGFYTTNQLPCNWGLDTTNAYGAGWTSTLGCGGGDPSSWTWGRGQAGNNNYNIGAAIANRLWQTWICWD